MRVGLLLKRGKPEAVEIARDLLAWLAERKVEAWVVADHVDPTSGARGVDEDELREGIDLLVVLGGDGTLLHGAELVGEREVPILGVNLGNLGFLTSCPPSRARETLEAALDGELVCERRMRLRVTLDRGDGDKVTRLASNDAVISQGALARLLELEALVDGHHINTYRADGLIVASPTGSTAYSLAAGGPILTPDTEAMVVTPICPHTLTNRPVVLPASSTLTVRLAMAARNVMLTVDGQWGALLSERATVTVQAADRAMLLYRPPNTTFFDILREKLQWGARVG